MLNGLICFLSIGVTAAQTDLFVGNNSSFVTNTYSAGGSTFSDLYIGNEVGDKHNAVIVSNNNTTFGVTRYARVGWAGSGNSLHILGGARMDAGYGGFVGYMTSSTNNTLVVAGSGSRLFADLHVGYDGSHNTLIVSNGGMVSGDLSIGGGEEARNGNEQSGNSNSVIVTGVGSHLQAEWIMVGASGSFNRLVVSNGALLSGPLRSSWFYPGSSDNIIHITGTNSVWDAKTGIYNDTSIFDASGSQLLVTDGATLVSTNGADVFSRFQIGGPSGKGNFDVLVDGKGSLMHHYRLVVGNTLGDVCRITVSGGGRIQTTYLDTSTNASTTLTITDPDSHLMLHRYASLWGDVLFTIKNGATVAAEGVQLSNFNLSPVAPRGVVDGVGTRVQLSWLSVGYPATSLTIKNGGLLVMETPSFAVPGNPWIWIGSNAFLDIGGFGGADSAGFVQAPYVELSSGGIIRFNQTNNAVLDASVYGDGEIHHYGTGSTTLGGGMFFNGAFKVFSGQLVLSDTGYMRFVVGPGGSSNQVIGAGSFVANGKFGFDLAQAPKRTRDSWQIVSAGSASYGPNFSVDGFSNSGLGPWDRLTNQTLYRFDQTSGTLSVVSGSTNIPYNRWVTNFPGLPNLSASADPDGDGYNNQQEFAFNGNPVDPTPSMLRIESRGSNAKISFVGRRNTNEAAYYIMSTTSLSSGTWQTNNSVSLIESADQEDVIFPDEYIRREFTVPVSGRNFFRIKAEVLQ